MSSKLFRETNAIVAIVAREIVRYLHSPVRLAFSLFMPIIFVGLLGGSISQNLASGLPFNFMQFALLGMTAANLYMVGLGGVSTLLAERENGFTQEVFVAPVSRYSIILGKVIGATVTAMFTLIGIFIVALILRIPLTWEEAASMLLIAPVVALAGAALGIFFISIARTPEVADNGSFLLVFPQIFLAGAIIPVTHASGVLGVIAHVLPMTYLIDLMRGVFYHGTATYSHVVLHTQYVDWLVTVAFFVFFVIAGTILFVRSEQNR